MCNCIHRERERETEYPQSVQLRNSTTAGRKYSKWLPGTELIKALSPTSSSLQASFNPGSGTADSGSAEQVFCGRCFKLQTNCGVQRVPAHQPLRLLPNQCWLMGYFVPTFLHSPPTIPHTRSTRFWKPKLFMPAGCKVHDIQLENICSFYWHKWYLTKSKYRNPPAPPPHPHFWQWLLT